MKEIVFATNNAHKLQEIRAILGSRIAVRSLEEIGCHDDIPETSPTLEGNALQKARYVFERFRTPCFADDTGLEVRALGGAPGVHTARYAYPDRQDTEANTDRLLRELAQTNDRCARFRTVIAYIGADGGERLFEGVVDGHIATERRGTDGFGYDPVFAPGETGLTFAEMGVEAKNRISHRARAVQKLCAFLGSTLG
ncbi:MAG: RdgB/HAM1 family non-canonical purine NTP pyrophosphatase [Bacteroidaceae bacterium]|nr:RdgB/HAM1 family non-canonical purine NTP pyrophosphatase [Bacteroidaceae bacterium]